MVLVANWATNFWVLIVSTENLGALATVFGTMSCPVMLNHKGVNLNGHISMNIVLLLFFPPTEWPLKFWLMYKLRLIFFLEQFTRLKRLIYTPENTIPNDRLPSNDLVISCQCMQCNPIKMFDHSFFLVMFIHSTISPHGVVFYSVQLWQFFSSASLLLSGLHLTLRYVPVLILKLFFECPELHLLLHQPSLVWMLFQNSTVTSWWRSLKNNKFELFYLCKTSFINSFKFAKEG